MFIMILIESRIKIYLIKSILFSLTVVDIKQDFFEKNNKKIVMFLHTLYAYILFPVVPTHHHL